MIVVHRSHRTEALADAYAGVLDAPGGDPFAPEPLVVQSRGMAQWLQLALVARHGVVANLRVLQPRELIDEAVASLRPIEGDPAAPWRREAIAWRLFRLLPDVVGDARFAVPASWLVAGAGGDDAATRRWQLAGRIAHAFDQYLVYRPDLVAGWSAGLEPDDWQASLWRRLEAEAGRGHLVGRLARPATGAGPAWPRLALFGISSLPPLYLDVLHELGQHLDVHLFLLAPSAEFFGDVVGARERSRALRGRGPDAAEALHLAEGHPLLAALGRVGRDFQNLVEERLPERHEPGPVFAPSGSPSVLGRLQDDLLLLRAPAGDVPLPHDATFRVLGCHSPAREVEVVRDELLALLRDVPGLEPRDVVVLVPDITVHGPLVDAVFGVDPSDPAWIPYSVADRPVASGSEVVKALLAMLGLVGTRAAAPDVLELLAYRAVRARFGLEEDDLAAVEAVVAGAGARWGLDAAHRAASGQPEVDGFTWRFALDRLVLGHATGADVVLGGRAPLAHVEGDAVRLVTALLAFTDVVLGALRDLAAPRPAAAWAATLGALVDATFGGDDDAVEDVRRVHAVLVAFATDAADAGVDEAVPLDVVRDRIEVELGGERRHGAFLRGGVTFCEMLPMRSIPARVVVLMGLSDGVFPRADAVVGFDRVAAAPRRGDRSKRDDDRYLVLEALVAARDAIRFTYVSRSVKDNESLPPSVVLADVLDAVDATFARLPDGRLPREALFVEHPLQPFSVRYVESPPDAPAAEALVTFDAAADAGARRLLRPSDPEPPFLTCPIPPDRTPTEIDLRQLDTFFKDSVAWFLHERLGVARPADVAVLPAREPLGLDGLEAWGVGDRLLRLRRQGLPWAACVERLHAEGLVPLGVLAGPALGVACTRVDHLLRKAGGHLAEPALPPVVVEAEVGAVRVVGRLDDVRAGVRVEVRYRSLRTGAVAPRLQAWIRHLALQLGPDGPRATEVYGYGDDNAVSVRFPELDPGRAHELLSALVELYLHGHATPLRFTPDLGAALLKGGARDARRHLEELAHKRPEAVAPWDRLLGGTAWLDDSDAVETARAAAATILHPLFAAEA